VEPPDTNILVASVPDAPALVGKLWEAGVQVTPLAPDRIRCVTHLDVDREGIERSLAAFREVLR
jgi:threonine aldolase